MSAEPLSISVVIPAYNSATFVGAAVASARAQTRAACEIIVIDDGSTDATAAKAEAAGATVIRQDNAGPGAARNAGIRMAKGDWIAFLDADDTWHPDKLERQWAARAKFEDALLVASDFVLVSPAGPLAPSVLATHEAYRKTVRTELGDGVVLIERHAATRGIASGQFLCPSTVLVERDLVRRIPFADAASLPPDGAWKIAEDLEWYLRVLRQTDVLVLERPLVDYLAHPGGRSSRAGPMRYGDTKLVEVVGDDPFAYAEGTLEYLRAVRPQKLREASLAFLLEGDYESARMVLGEAWRSLGRPDDGLLLAFAVLFDRRAGRALTDVARKTWRRTLKPSIARLRRSRP